MTHALNPYQLGDAAQGAFLGWWHRIHAENPSGTARADRAVLRRANDLTAIAITPAYQRVYREMREAAGGAEWHAFQQERIAALVGLAAHVSVASPLSLPKAMSHRTEGATQNPVSDLRFARLLDAPDIDSLFVGIRRCLPLIKHAVDPASLARDVFQWGDFVKRRWAYDYDWASK